MKTTLLICTLILCGTAIYLSRDESPKAQPGYVIEKQGTFYPDEFFAVLSVYGFSDNEHVTKEIVIFLETSEVGGNYRYREWNEAAD